MDEREFLERADPSELRMFAAILKAEAERDLRRWKILALSLLIIPPLILVVLSVWF